MIDPHSETLCTMTEAAKSLPHRPDITTIWRWRSRGIAGVKLETVSWGGRTYTSLEALARFAERVTAAKSGERLPVRTNQQRARAQRAAKKQLQNAGLID
jgi:hypothetical protein